MNTAGRSAELRELMDDPDVDLVRLERTYAHFRLVNAVLTDWRRLYQREIRPRLDPRRTSTLLDVGSGGGDVARRLARWARADGLPLEVTGVDPDPRAHDWALRGRTVPGLSFERTDTTALVRDGRRFDVVVSNHLLHHLRDGEVLALLADSTRLAGSLVLHDDLERSTGARLAWGVLALPAARRSLLRHDGMVSIRRSFTRDELARLVPGGWTVHPRVPSRLVLRHVVGEDRRAH